MHNDKINHFIYVLPQLLQLSYHYYYYYYYYYYYESLSPFFNLFHYIILKKISVCIMIKLYIF